MSAQELITQHLDLWTGAVTAKSTAGRGISSGKRGKIELTGIKKLRELILELAVRGKLVDQDPSDEPASVLLERISEEKTRLVKEGKIKQPKKLPEISPDDLPASLPMGWEAATLSHLGVFCGGKTPSKSKSVFWNGDIPWVTPKDMKIAEISDAEDHVTEIATDSGGLELLPQGTLLFVVRSGILRRMFPTAITRVQCTINQDLKALQLFKPEMARYAQIMARGYEGFILKHLTKTGTTVESLKFNEFSLQPFPLPPLNEQHRIIEKVDELMALCDRLEQQVGDQLEAHEVLVDTLLDALTRSADATEVAENWARIAEHFDTLFTTEASIDKLKLVVLDLAADGKLIEFHVDKQPLKSILLFGPRNGLSPKESSSHTGFKVLKLGATTKGKLALNESKNIDILEPESSHLWLKSGDILIQRGNAASHVGCNVLIEEDYPTFIYPDLMMKIRTKEEADPKFISAYLSAPLSRKFMWERMTGTSGTMPKISKKVVEAIPIALPDLKIQKATVEKIDEVTALCDQLKARLAEAGETRAHLAEAVVEQAVS